MKNWHNRRMAEGKEGVDSLYFISSALVLALVAFSVAIYGISLRLPATAAGNGAAARAEASVHSDTLVKPPKFYSQRNKNDLADALTDLSGILNTTGDDIVRKTDTLMRMWEHQMVLGGQQKNPDTVSLIKQSKALSDATVVLNRSIYDDDGFLEKHKNYADEMNSILKLPRNSPNSNPIDILQVSINGFVNVVTTIELATKYNDPRLVGGIMQNMRPALFSFQKGDETFRTWLAQTRERIEAFRNTLG